jgi:hypothetical protein
MSLPPTQAGIASLSRYYRAQSRLGYWATRAKRGQGRFGRPAAAAVLEVIVRTVYRAIAGACAS